MKDSSDGYQRIDSKGSSFAGCVNLIITILICVVVVGILVISIYNISKSLSNGNDIKNVSGSVSSLNDSVRSLSNSVLKLTDSIPGVDSRFSLPSKYSISYSVPRLLQLNRGTCWAFGAVGALEHSYRLNGIKNGYLQSDEYVPFSLQAYGISIVNECKSAPDVCEILGDEVYLYPDDIGANTDGGEVSYLYYLRNLWSQIFPETICPYLPESDNWTVCPDLQNAIDSNRNPIRFNITAMQTTYDVEDTKALLYTQNETLSISTPVHDNYLFVPCYNTTLFPQSPLCKEYADEEKVLCPPWIHLAYANDDGSAVKCIKQWQPGYNMDGEWYLAPHVEYMAEGGHAMQIVGYNDRYRSFPNDVGGFVIKNSWVDQSYLFNISQGLGRGGRGSHSIDYLMMRISDWDEKQICPNADSPLNWLSCTEISGGPTGAGDGDVPSRKGNTRRLTTNPKLRNRIRRKVREFIKADDSLPKANQANPAAMCLNATIRKHFVNLTKQPMEFKCRIEPGSNASERFGCSPNNRYFLDWLEIDVNGYADANFIEVLPDNSTAQDFPLYTLPVAVVAEVFLVNEEYDDDENFYRDNLLNSADECGYYFYPYSLLEKSTRKASSWFATHFNVDWSPSSYLSQRGEYGIYDYTYLESGVKTQTKHTYGGPQPYTPDAANPTHPIPDWPWDQPRSSNTRMKTMSKRNEV